MIRREFVKNLFALSALAIPASTIVEYEVLIKVLKNKLLIDFNPAPHGWFKITNEFWKQCSDDDGPYSIKMLDDLCIKMCGTPVKEVGYIDDDFARDMLTVYAWSKDKLGEPNYNGRMMYDE